MPIATKNNAIILKDGRLAENCGCCGGLCVCDATSVKVSVLSGNFLRHMLLRASSGAEARVSLGYIAAPSSGVHVLRKDTIGPQVGISPSKWVSDNVPSPGSGRITAVVYRPSGNAPVRVTVGIPVWYWRSVDIRFGGTFKSLDEMIAESKGGKTALQGHGTLVIELACDSQTGTSRIISYSPGGGFGGGWSPVGSQIPFTACDFTDVNGVLGFSDWWEGEALLKGTERLLSQGMSIVSDTRTGDNIVTLDGINLTCCEDEADGACCTTVGATTTCAIKKQCQCQCTTGRCCGPDTVTIRNGAETWPVYRVETKQACLARGGTWKCGTFGPQSIEGYVGTPLCGSASGTTEPVFKGVGTTCATGTCLTGACCGNNSLVCSVTTQEACEAAGGRYQGNGTNCSTANCCPSAYNPSWVGSCCVTSRQNGPFAFRCYSMTKSQCASAGGLFSCAQRCSGGATQSDDLGFYGSCNQAGIDAGLFNDGNPLP